MDYKAEAFLLLYSIKRVYLVYYSKMELFSSLNERKLPNNSQQNIRNIQWMEHMERKQQLFTRRGVNIAFSVLSLSLSNCMEPSKYAISQPQEMYYAFHIFTKRKYERLSHNESLVDGLPKFPKLYYTFQNFLFIKRIRCFNGVE